MSAKLEEIRGLGGRDEGNGTLGNVQGNNLRECEGMRLCSITSKT